MKKNILILIIAVLSQALFCEEKIEKINSFSNDKNSSFYNPFREVGDDGDTTGVGIKFDNEGNCYFFNSETLSMYKFDKEFKKTDFVMKLDFLERGYEGIAKINEDYYLVTGIWGRCKKYDKNLKMIFSVNLSDMKISTENAYYDEDTDTIFYQLTGDSVSCLLHPSMDQQQNKKNYRTPEQTKAMIKNKEFGTHIALSESNNLIIDGAVTPWGTVWYGKYRYQLSTINNRVSLWNGSTVKRIVFEKKENEVLESMAIHPSGDIYRLVYDKSTKLHTLYRVENTWDPKWRKQWYKKHK